jgi:hypothetical protein
LRGSWGSMCSKKIRVPVAHSDERVVAHLQTVTSHVGGRATGKRMDVSSLTEFLRY